MRLKMTFCIILCSGIMQACITLPTESGGGSVNLTPPIPLSVKSFSPTSGTKLGGTTVTLSGAGFLPGATATIGYFDCDTPTVVSSTEMTCVTHAQDPGRAYVVISNGDGRVTTLKTPFIITSATVDSISPSLGPADTLVTITGTHFLTGITASIGGVECTSPTLVSETQMTCYVGLSSQGSVTIVNLGGETATSTGSIFTYLLPTVTAISPPSATAGTLVTLTGTQFLSGITATVGGVQCTTPTLISPTRMTCILGANSAHPGSVTILNTNGETATSLYEIFSPLSPTVAAISPSSAPAGTLVTLTGSSFAAGITARLGSVDCTSPIYISPIAMTCIVGVDSVGTHTVTVSNTNGETATTSSAIFTYELPTVTMISPTSGTAGSLITISGTGFLSGITASIGGVACSSPTLISSTVMTCTAGVHSTGAVSVTIENTNGETATSIGSIFTYALPAVVTINPTSGPAGSLVTITGTGFLSGIAASIGGVDCSSPTFISSTEMTCIVGIHSAGTATVTILNSNGETATSPSSIFTYELPTITAISPTSGTEGTSVTLTGTGFLAGITVSIGGVTCSSPSLVSSTQLTCTVGAHIGGSATVTILNPNTQTATSSSSIFSYSLPTVTAIAPSSGIALGGTSVTITGTGFLAGATVSIGGVSCIFPQLVSSTEITCNTKSTTPGSATVTVLNTNGQSGTSSTSIFTFTTPTVTTIVPASGTTLGGTLVTITGTEFLSGITATVGEVECTSPTLISSTEMTCNVGANSAGAVTVTILNENDQTATSSSAIFTYALPTVTSISPATGNAGTLVTITGTGFLTGIEATIGGTACTSPTLISSTQMTCITGIHAEGPSTVTITNTNGQTGTSTSSIYQYNPYSVSLFAGSVGIPGSTNGTTTSASFGYTNGLATDSSGNVYVADFSKHTIRKISPAGEVTTLAGSAGLAGSTNDTGGAARFNFPAGVALDASGNVYVADYGNHTIRKISPAAVVTTLAGSAGLSGSLNGTGSAARFNGPTGLTVDSSGNIYVADYNNNTIREITSAGVVTTLAGAPGTTGSTDGTGSAARLNSPTGVAVDTSGNLYVADSDNSTVRKIITQGGSKGVVTTFAGTAGSSGSQDDTGSGARFSLANSGIGVDSGGNVYLSEDVSHRIRKITPTGIVTTIAGISSVGSQDGAGSLASFNTPSGITVDSSGIIYVGDYNNFTIRKITNP